MEPETLTASPTVIPLPAATVEGPAVRVLPVKADGEDFAQEAAGDASRPESESLFERFGWLYAFFREHLFRDDTEGISAALWPQGAPPAGSRLLELGCGPGFYCCQFGERFRELRRAGHRPFAPATPPRPAQRPLAPPGERALRAIRRAAPRRWKASRVDSLLAARLFTILPQREEAMAEMHRVTARGRAMFRRGAVLAAAGGGPAADHVGRGEPDGALRVLRSRAYREPPDATVLAPEAFGALVHVAAVAAVCALAGRALSIRDLREGSDGREDGHAAGAGAGGQLRDLSGG